MIGRELVYSRRYDANRVTVGRNGLYTLVCLKLGVDFLLKNWEFRVFAKQPLSKKLGILRFRQTGHVQKIGTFMIRRGLIRNIFYSRNELHKQIIHNDCNDCNDWYM